jgi:phosphotransferase system enzyme I (PtsP)
MKVESRKPLAGTKREASALPATTRGHGFTVLEDVTAATEHSEDLQEALQRIVEVIAKRTHTDVCSVYLLEPRVQRLTLRATTGLERSAVGKVMMTVGEGLTGMVIEKLEPVMVVDAMSHPRYKFFPETGEERYHSFLGVPVLERGTPLGVLVVQTLRRRKFSATEVRLLRAIAAQVAGVLVQARLLDDLRKEKERSESRRAMLAAMKRLHDFENRIEAGEAPPRRKRARDA